MIPCKTMSLHVRRLNASLHTHPLMYNMYKSQFPNSIISVVSTTKCTSAQLLTVLPLVTPPGSTLASTTAAWAHVRALRDTGNTFHGSPDLGEGSSRAHTCTTCPWNAKRRRQDYGCTCMCGSSRGCSTSSGDEQTIKSMPLLCTVECSQANWSVATIK